MKTKYEFKDKALRFASKDGIKYDAVRCNGLYNDYEVYTPYKKSWKKNPPCIGLPRLILVNQDEIKWDNSRSPFEVYDILNNCKKIPRLYFEYYYHGWRGSTCIIQLFTDGTLLKIEHDYTRSKKYDSLVKDKEILILKDKVLQQEIKKIIKENDTILEKLPKFLANNDIDDGIDEKIKIGKYRFHGINAYPYNYNPENKIIPSSKEELFKYQTIFIQIRDTINEKAGTSVF